MLEVEKRIAENGMRGAVTISDHGLYVREPLQLRVLFVEIETLQKRIRRGADAKVVLKEKHVRDLLDVGGVLAAQAARIVRRTEGKQA